jgi:hypothetical protein
VPPAAGRIANSLVYGKLHALCEMDDEAKENWGLWHLECGDMNSRELAKGLREACLSGVIQCRMEFDLPIV